MMKCLLSFREDATVGEMKSVTEALGTYLDAKVESKGINDSLLECDCLKDGYSNIISASIDPLKCDFYIIDDKVE